MYKSLNLPLLRFGNGSGAPCLWREGKDFIEGIGVCVLLVETWILFLASVEIGHASNMNICN